MAGNLLFYILVGCGAGAMYAILGVGLVTTYRGTGVINFAYGAVAMYVTFTYSDLRRNGSVRLPWVNFLPGGAHFPVKVAIGSGPMGFVPAFLLTLVFAVLLGVLIHLLVFRPLRSASPLGKVVASVGLLIYLQAVALINFGSSTRILSPVLPNGSWKNFLGLHHTFPAEDLWAALIAVGVALVVWFGYQKTRIGTATRAAAANEKGAVLLGYSPDLLAASSWVLAAVLGAVMGVFVGPIAGSLDPSGYTAFIVPALGAALVGSLSSVGLAMVGGLLLGAIESVALYLSNSQSWWPSVLQGSGLSSAIPLLVIGVVLFVRGASIPVRGTVGERALPAAPRPARMLPWAIVGFAAPVIFGIAEKGPWVLALTSSMITAVLLLSYVVVTGYTGQISLAQLGISGAAAFVLLRLTSDGKQSSVVSSPVPGLHWPFIVALPVSIAVAAAVGFIVGLPAVRIRGVHLAVITIAAGVALEQLWFNNPKLTGIPLGSAGSVPPARLFGQDIGVLGPRGLSDNLAFTVFVAVILVGTALVVTNLRRSATGRRFLAVRANERAAASAGINVTGTKLLAFTLAASIAGLSGCLLALQQQTITLSNFDTLAGLGLVAFAYMGGISSVNGAVVGGVIGTAGLVSYLGQVHFPHLTNYWEILGGVGVIVTAIANPAGVAPNSQTMMQAFGRALLHWRGAEWFRALRRLGPPVVIGALAGWALWDRHHHANAWPVIDGVALALLLRGTALQIWSSASVRSLMEGVERLSPFAPGHPMAAGAGGTPAGVAAAPAVGDDLVPAAGSDAARNSAGSGSVQ